MKTVPPLLQQILDGSTMRLALLLEIRRFDGTVLRFTDHDEPVTETDTFLPGMKFGPQAQKASTSPANNTVELLVDDASITRADLETGRFDDAQVFTWLVDWSQPQLGRVALMRGTTGETDVGDTRADVAVRGLSDKLRQTLARTFATSCDADLGDDRCQVDLGPFTFSDTVTTVVGADNDTVDVAGLGGQSADYFQFGSFVWTSGPNSGRKNQVKNHTQEGGAARLELAFPAPFTISPGDGLTVVAGCNKDMLEHCIPKFDNVVNFRGFPYIPGQNQILKTGGQ